MWGNKDQFAEVDNRIRLLEQNILAEVRQLNISAEVSKLQTDLFAEVTRLRAGLSAEISKLRTDLFTRSQTLERSFGQTLQQFQAPLKELQGQVSDLHSLVSGISPLSSSGEQKPIHERIKVYTEAIASAIVGLEQEHADWLEQQHARLLDTQATLEVTREHLASSVVHISPSNGTTPLN
jgi:hypothetical protein